jgi:hypothetical protein
MNPYVVGQWVRGERFYGRVELIDEVLAMQRSTPPPDPATISPAIPGELAAITLRCLAKDPADRIANAVELEGSLRRIADSL